MRRMVFASMLALSDMPRISSVNQLPVNRPVSADMMSRPALIPTFASLFFCCCCAWCLCVCVCERVYVCVCECVCACMHHTPGRDVIGNRANRAVNRLRHLSSNEHKINKFQSTNRTTTTTTTTAIKEEDLVVDPFVHALNELLAAFSNELAVCEPLLIRGAPEVRHDDRVIGVRAGFHAIQLAVGYSLHTRTKRELIRVRRIEITHCGDARMKINEN